MAFSENELNEIRERYKEYVTPARVNGFVCPACRSGTKEHGTGLVYKNGYFRCFNCNFYGDGIDIYASENNLSFVEAVKELESILGIKGADLTINERKEKNTINVRSKEKKAIQGEIKPQNFTDYYKQCMEYLKNNKVAQDYLKDRGISLETALKFWIGYDPQADPANNPGIIGNAKRKFPTPRIIIPFGKSHYMGRAINENEQIKKCNSKSLGTQKQPFFNEKALYSDQKRPVFITEGVFDALSIIEAGSTSISINSASNADRLAQTIAEKNIKKSFIIVSDNDDAGRLCEAKLITAFKNIGVSFTTCKLYTDCKDANEAFIKNPEAFIKAVNEAERAHSMQEKEENKENKENEENAHIIENNNFDNIADYILLKMREDIENLKQQSGRKTGFNNLDSETRSIYSGLYVVGGISSVGKTTFVHQMADQMAENGEHVLFFSMEQSKLELVTKSIARETANTDITKAIQSIRIRTGEKNEVTQKAIYNYQKKIGDRLNIIEGNFDSTVTYIRDYIKKYIGSKEVKPIVFVDYLQVLQPDNPKLTDTKKIVDYNVTELKRISRDFEIPIFVISSFNRTNYLSPIDFESFKESGNIEYTADVVWGLQLKIVNDEKYKNSDTTEKRAAIINEKEAEPRKIQLVCLKNRYGKSYYTADFLYYPKYDLYVADQQGEFNKTYDKTPFDKTIKKI